MSDARLPADPMCADCAGWDIEWMYHCQKHKGVQYCRGCSCPYCAEDAYDDEDDEPMDDATRYALGAM